MQITGSYNNYLNVTKLLKPLGVSTSGDLVMQVFSSALQNLQDKLGDQIFSENSQAALNQLYGDLSSLSVQAKKLTLDDYNSVFNDRTASSSDAGVLTATAVNAFSADSGAAKGTYSISVTQVAQTQVNTGLDLDHDAASVVGTGTNTFTVTIGGQDHELEVIVSEGDTNEEVLRKIALAINGANLGINAGIGDGGEAGTRNLTVTAMDTGASSAFTISDVSGNAVSATGVGTVSRAAQYAAYSVDGASTVSSSNTIYLNEGLVTVTLKGTGDSVLTVSPDEEKIEDAVTALVSGLNTVMGNLEKNSDYIKDEVFASVASFITDNRSGLASIGISQNEDGTLVIDKTLLSAAVSGNMDTIKDVLNDFDGLAVRITGYASRVATDSPLNYAKEAENVSTEFTDYIYGTSAGLLQRMMTGSMLDVFA